MVRLTLWPRARPQGAVASLGNNGAELDRGKCRYRAATGPVAPPASSTSV